MATNWRALALECVEILEDDTPEPNCTCFQSAPCSDCVEYAGQREMIATIRNAAKREDEESAARSAYLHANYVIKPEAGT